MLIVNPGKKEAGSEEIGKRKSQPGKEGWEGYFRLEEECVQRPWGSGREAWTEKPLGASVVGRQTAERR